MGPGDRFCKENVKNLAPYVPGYQPEAGEPILKLNSNENAYPPSLYVLQVMRDHLHENLRLYPNSRSAALRRKLAEFYGMKEEQIFCGNGCDEIISLIFRTFAERSDKVIMPYPTYTLYKTAAEIHEVPYEFIDTNDDFEIELDEYLNRSAKLCFLANPNAQTGILLPLDKIEGFLREYPGLLALDETYIDFAPEGSSAYRLVDRYDNLIVMRTFSKSSSLCGIRVGYAFGHPELIEALDKTKDSYNIAYLNQVAAVAALEDYEYVQNNAREIAKTRDWLSHELRELDFNVVPSAGNYILARHSQVAARDIYTRLLERNILVRYFNDRRLDEYVRISIGTPEQMQRVYKAIKDIVTAK